jgi:hypothetical protein
VLAILAGAAGQIVFGPIENHAPTIGPLESFVDEAKSQSFCVCSRQCACYKET